MFVSLSSSLRPSSISRNVAVLRCLCSSQEKPDVSGRRSKGLPSKIPIPGVKHVILVSSGKGGVGKSATSVNLALSLARMDKNTSVGILDADVYGPSIPKMMNLEGQQPEVNSQNIMQPLVNFGIKCMSMGFLVDPDKAIVWRGLMVMSAINRLLRQVTWGPLDYLIVDMPPGTGDTQLSISQSIPVSGAVIVTTPQSISLLDVDRSIDMYKKVNIPIFGIVVNMSHFICNKCDTEHLLFGGSDAVESIARKHGTEILCRVPFNSNIMLCNDNGQPIYFSDDKSVSSVYSNLAHRVTSKLHKPLT